MSKIKITWRGTRDEANEMKWGGRRWESNIPQEVLDPEESAKQQKDGYFVEESELLHMPNGESRRIPKRRWLSLAEAARNNGCFDVEGEPPKVMQRWVTPERYPNAALEAGGDIWIGENA